MTGSSSQIEARVVTTGAAPGLRHLRLKNKQGEEVMSSVRPVMTKVD